MNTREGHNRYRLPTEAEWEYACRAGTTSSYFFGNHAVLLDRYAWYSRNANGITQPVGQKAPNPWGLYDMNGNVWEWAWDWYNEQTYYASPPQDPSGPERGKKRVLRGGSWKSNAENCRAATQGFCEPGIGSEIIGFRLAMMVE